MAITHEQAENIKKAYATFTEMLGPRYVDCQENADAIKQQMREAGLSSNAWVVSGAWLEFWAIASQKGLLIEPDAPPTPQELKDQEFRKQREKEARDRFAGSRAGNRVDAIDPREDEENERQKAANKARIDENERKRAARKARDEAQAALVIPSVAQLIAGEFKLFGQLTGAEAARYSREQLNAYVLNSKKAQLQITADRENARVKSKEEWLRNNV